MESRGRGSVYNILSIGMLMASVATAGMAAAVFFFPHSPVNPFPPAQPTAPVATAFPETSFGSSPSPAASKTAFMAPTAAILSTSAATVATAAPPPTQTAAPATPTGLDAGFPFALTDNGVVATISEKGCAWSGVAGRVLDPLGLPIANLPVILGGKLNGRVIQLETQSGTATGYGNGAFEFSLGDQPIPSENTLWIQLLDSNKNPISAAVFLTTYEGCDRNLLIVDFRQRVPAWPK